MAVAHSGVFIFRGGEIWVNMRGSAWRPWEERQARGFIGTQRRETSQAAILCINPSLFFIFFSFYALIPSSFIYFFIAPSTS